MIIVSTKIISILVGNIKCPSIVIHLKFENITYILLSEKMNHLMLQIIIHQNKINNPLNQNKHLYFYFRRKKYIYKQHMDTKIIYLSS